MAGNMTDCPVCARWEMISLVETCPLCGAPGGAMELNDLAIRVIEEYRDRCEDLRVFGTTININ